MLRLPRSPVVALGLALSLARCGSGVEDLTDTGVPIDLPDVPGSVTTDVPLPDVPTGAFMDVPVGFPDGPATGTDAGTVPDDGPAASVCGLCASPDQVCCPTLRVCFVPGSEDCPTERPDAGLDAPTADVPDDSPVDARAMDVADRDATDDVTADTPGDGHEDTPGDVHEDVRPDVVDPCLGRCTGITACCPATRLCILPGRSFCPSYDAGVSRCGGVVCPLSWACCAVTGRCFPRTCTFCCR